MASEETITCADVCDAFALLRNFGFRIGLDWDDSLLIETPDSLDPEAIADLIERANVVTDKKRGWRFVTEHLKQTARHDRARFIGGSLDGQHTRPRLSGYYVFKGFRQCKVHHAGRAKWEVYHIVNDGRGYFLGAETNKKKALGLFDERTKRLVKDSGR